MTTGRKTLDDLLRPISEQLGRESVPAEVPRVDVASLEPARVTDGMTQAGLVDLFASEAAKVRVDVRRCAPEGAAAAVRAIIEEPNEVAESDTVVYADDLRLEELGIVEALEGSDAVSEVARWDAGLGRDANVERAARARFGITVAAGGIAETGTVVQPCSASCGRSVSLLPLEHIAVVYADTIRPTMLEAMRELEEAGKARADGNEAELPSQVCLISGPSNTSDIELVRVEGVHGPLRVHYVVVE